MVGFVDEFREVIGDCKDKYIVKRSVYNKSLERTITSGIADLVGMLMICNSPYLLQVLSVRLSKLE